MKVIIMKKSDIILITVILIAAMVSWIVFRQINNESSVEDGTAIVYYNNDKILEIQLDDGSYTIFDPLRIIEIDVDEMTYHVEGSNPYGVVIKYNDFKVRVIDEISPKNICQTQGWTNSTLSPLTCLPNNIIVVIEAPSEGDVPDDITS
jgi:hypothetical protein